MKIKNIIYKYTIPIVFTVFVSGLYVYMFCDNCKLLTNVMMTLIYIVIFLFSYREETIKDFINGNFVKQFFGFIVFSFLLVLTNFMDGDYLLLIYIGPVVTIVNRVRYILQAQEFEKNIQKSMEEKNGDSEVKK